MLDLLSRPRIFELQKGDEYKLKIGYIRVSTNSQNIDRQLDQLKTAGCEKLYIDKFTGTKANRPKLDEMFKYLRSGDTVIVTELARLGRSTKDLIKLVDRIREIGADFICLKDNIDTTTPYGKFFFTINCAFSQLQRDLIVENTKQGIEAARARGRVGGRPAADKKAVEKAIKLYNAKTHSLREIQELTGISKNTLYKYLRAEKN